MELLADTQDSFAVFRNCRCVQYFSEGSQDDKKRLSTLRLLRKPYIAGNSDDMLSTALKTRVKRSTAELTHESSYVSNPQELTIVNSLDLVLHKGSLQQISRIRETAYSLYRCSHQVLWPIYVYAALRKL